jgi:pilus assembly protein CpaB
MNKRALLIAAILATLGAVLLLIYLQRFEQEASGGERVRVLMAAKPIKAGQVLTQDMLAVREIPIAYVEDRAVKASERAKVIGLRVGNNVQTQETLFWTDLAIASDERRDLSSLIQKGNLAVSIPAHGEDKSFELIRPGDYVDLIANLPAGPSKGADPTEGERRLAVVLLQKVLVLAVGLQTTPLGAKTDKGHGPGNQEMVLTVSLDNLQDVQRLSLAAQKGIITVALRNPDDQHTVEDVSNVSSNALTNEQAHARGGGRGGPIRLGPEAR